MRRLFNRTKFLMLLLAVIWHNPLVNAQSNNFGSSENPPCIIANANQVACDNMATVDESDDMITYDIDAIYIGEGTPSIAYAVTAINTSGQINLGSFPYGIVMQITVPYAQGTSLVFSDANDMECTEVLTPEMINCPLPCSSPLGDFLTVGDAIVLGDNCFQLTDATNNQSGAVWYQNQLDLSNDFMLDFNLNFGTNNTTSTGADGMMFILQTVGNQVSGVGGLLGFEGLVPSVGVEFDTWRNNESNLNIQDPVEDHMSFQKNGSVRHNTSIINNTEVGYLDPMVPFTLLPELEDGMNHNVIITWDATNLVLTANIDGITSSVTQDIVNTIFGGNPQVFWGWSSTTGSQVNIHTLCVNNIVVTDAIVAIPEISTIPCEGGTASIDLNVSGGVPGYTFAWSDSNNTTTEDLFGITSPGDYTVTITDACNNTLVQTYTVGEETGCCEIVGFASQIACDNQGTPTTADDLITYHVSVLTSGIFSGTFFVANNLSVFGPFPNSGGTISIPYSASTTFFFYDSEYGSSACSYSLTLNPTPCPPTCEIVGFASQIGCDNQGTQTTADDIITYNVSASVTNGSSNGTFFVANSLTVFGPFPNSGGTISIPYSASTTFFFYDSEYGSSACSYSLTLEPTPCPPCNTITSTSIDAVSCTTDEIGNLLYEFDIRIWDPNGLAEPLTVTSPSGQVIDVEVIPGFMPQIPELTQIKGILIPNSGIGNTLCFDIDFENPDLCSSNVCIDKPECECVVDNVNSQYPECINPGEEFCFNVSFDYYGPIGVPVNFYLDNINSSNGYQLLSATNINTGSNTADLGQNEFELCFIYNGVCEGVTHLFYDANVGDCSIWEMTDLPCCDKGCDISNVNAQYPECVSPGEEFCFDFSFDYQGPLGQTAFFYLDGLNSSSGYYLTSATNNNTGTNTVELGYNEFSLCFIYLGNCKDVTQLFFDVLIGGEDCKLWEMTDLPCCPKGGGIKDEGGFTPYGSDFKSNDIMLAEVEVRPNPFVDNITIDVKSEKSGEGRFVLMDVLAKVIFDIEKNINEDETNIQLDVPVGSAGVYILQVTLPDGSTHTRKLVRK